MAKPAAHNARHPEAVPEGFVCLGCGGCCRIPGEVKVGNREIARFAHYLRMSKDAFIQKYTRLRQDRHGLALLDGEGDRCIFLDQQNRCAINPVKPDQCRSFPFAWNYPGYQRICRGARARSPGAKPPPPEPDRRP